MLTRPLVTLVLVALPVMTQAADKDVRAILRDAEVAAVSAGEEGLLNLLPEIGRAWAALGDMDTAIRAFDQSLLAVQAADMDPHDREMNVVALTEVRAAAGDIGGALKNCQTLTEPGLRGWGLFSVAVAHARQGDYWNAFETVDAIAAADAIWAGLALVEIVVIQSEHGDYQAALQAAGRIDRVPSNDPASQSRLPINRDNAYFEIAASQVRNGQTQSSLQTANLIVRESIKIRALLTIGEALAAAGDRPVAWAALADARAIAIAKRYDDLFVKIASGQAQAGDITGAVETVALMPAGPAKGHALFGIALARDKAADQAGAARTFEEALQLARQGGGGYVLHEIARHYGITGQLERALQIVDIEPDQTMNSLGRRLLAVDQAELGHTAQAIEIANTIPEGNNRAFAFYTIGVAQSKTDKDAATASLQIALAAAASEVGGGVEIQALCDIAVAQAALGATDAATATFEQARQAALVYSEDVYRASLYQMIAKAQTDSGDAAGALAAATAQTAALMKAASLIGVAQGLLERGQRDSPPTDD